MVLKKRMLENIFLFFWGILLISRLMVLTGNVNTAESVWILIEIAYIMICVFFLSIGFDGKIKIKSLSFNNYFIQIILLLYTILFGKILINATILEYINSYFKSQIMFIAIVIVTAATVKKYKIFDKFIIASFYFISIYMLIQLVCNISDLNLKNIANIFNKSERTRNSFGFGHPNNLGNICVCNIMLYLLLKNYTKEYFNSLIQKIFLIMTVLMLLCSASRSSISSLMMFYLVYCYLNLDKLKADKKIILSLKFLIVIIGIFTVFSVLSLFSVEDILAESNRSLVFEHTLPLFFNSGRIFNGLGYVSNSVYGNNLTPYRTYFIDNGYVYILVSTGIVGFIMILSVLIYIIRKIIEKKEYKIKRNMISIFCVYIYIALYEATLFNGGFFSNYIYVILFISYISFEIEEKFNLK